MSSKAASANDPSDRFEKLFRQYPTAKNILKYIGKIEANAMHATGPEGPISEEVEKHEYLTPIYI